MVSNPDEIFCRSLLASRTIRRSGFLERESPELVAMDLVIITFTSRLKYPSMTLLNVIVYIMYLFAVHP